MRTIRWLGGSAGRGAALLEVGVGDGFEVHIGRTEDGARVWASLETPNDLRGVHLGTFASVSEARRASCGFRRTGPWAQCGVCGRTFAGRFEDHRCKADDEPRMRDEGIREFDDQ
jgi:hypothetical protein